jgi:hypothetical protein
VLDYPLIDVGSFATVFRSRADNCLMIAFGLFLDRFGIIFGPFGILLAPCLFQNHIF